MKFKIVALSDGGTFTLTGRQPGMSEWANSLYIEQGRCTSRLYDNFNEAYEVFDSVRLWDLPLKIVPVDVVDVMVHVVTTAK